MARYGSEKSLHSLQPMHPSQSTRPIIVAAATSTTSLSPTMTTCTVTSPSKVTVASPTHVPNTGSADTPSELMPRLARIICVT
jgi:hypothetical protein